MNISTAVPLKLNQDVTTFLQHNRLESAFETLCKLAEECYPALHHLEAELWEDVDEPDLRYVVLVTYLPVDHSIDQAIEQSSEYSRRTVDQVPLSALLHLRHLEKLAEA